MENNLQTNQELNQPENSDNNTVKKYILVVWEFLKIVIIAAIIVLPIRYFIFQPFIVKNLWSLISNRATI